jgi:hypothetical protein
MLRTLGTGIFAASVLAAALACPVTASARDVAMTGAAASTSAARAQLTTPKPKRVRKQSLRRVAAVAAPSQPQCFLFWCHAGGRSYSLLMLGVAF